MPVAGVFRAADDEHEKKAHGVKREVARHVRDLLGTTVILDVGGRGGGEWRRRRRW